MAAIVLACLAVIGCFAAMLASLGDGRLPGFDAGWGFLASPEWAPVRALFGAAGPILGSAVLAASAAIIALTLAFGIAVAMTELVPPGIRRPLDMALKLLAAIPPVVYGLWGYFVVLPAFRYAGAEGGALLPAVAGLLAVMILPLLTARLRDLFAAVPPLLKDSAYALGCTRWEVMRRIVLPQTKAAVTGWWMLSIGRALGETVTLIFVIGNAETMAGSPAGAWVRLAWMGVLLITAWMLALNMLARLLLRTRGLSAV